MKIGDIVLSGEIVGVISALSSINFTIKGHDGVDHLVNKSTCTLISTGEDYVDALAKEVLNACR